MQGWYSIYFMMKWIWIFAFSLLFYMLTAANAVDILDSMLGIRVEGGMVYLVWSVAFAGMGYLLYLWYRKDSNYYKQLDAPDEFSEKYQYGVIIAFIGAFGLVAMDVFLLYIMSLHSNGFSGFFLIPFILWMGFFGFLGSVLISKGAYMQDLQTMAKKPQYQSMQTAIKKEISVEKKRSKKSIYLIIGVPIIFILFLVVINKFK